MKIKDLPRDANITDLRFVYPDDGLTYHLIPQWGKGIWGRRNPSDLTVYLLLCDDIKEFLEWEVAPKDTE